MASGPCLNAHKRYAPIRRQQILDDFEVFCMRQEERLDHLLHVEEEYWLVNMEMDPQDYELETRK